MLVTNQLIQQFIPGLYSTKTITRGYAIQERDISPNFIANNRPDILRLSALIQKMFSSLIFKIAKNTVCYSSNLLAYMEGKMQLHLQE